MAKKLTQLRVDEISLVDRGAGEGVLVKLAKKLDSGNRFNKIFGAEPTTGELLRRQLLKARAEGKLTGTLGLEKANDTDDDEDEDDDEAASTPTRTGSTRRRTAADIMRPSDLIAALQQISPRSRALLASAKRNDIRKEMEMTRDQKLVAIGKDFSTLTIAKQVIKQQDAGLSEAEVTKMFAASIKRRDGESSAQAFARAFSAQDAQGEAMRRAVTKTRDRAWLSRLNKQGGPPGAGGATDEDLERDAVQDEQQDWRDERDENSLLGLASRGQFADPNLPEGGSGSGRPDNVWGVAGSRGISVKRAAGSSAYGEITAKAAELRKRDPSLTREQAFTKAYEAPSSVALRNRERAELRARLGAG